MTMARLAKAVLAVLAVTLLLGQTAPGYPSLALVRDDPALTFIQTSVQNYYRYELGSAPRPELALFSLHVPAGADLLGIASRTGILAESIATLNGLRYSTQELPGTLIVPNIPGIFIADGASDDLSALLRTRFAEAGLEGVQLTVNRPGGRATGRYYPGQRLGSAERLLFLQRYFAPPLRAFRISARFGLGQNPFEPGLRSHQGIDLVPTGSDLGVRASAPGTVRTVGNNTVFGNYVIVRHDTIFTSLYAHLSVISVRTGQDLATGTVIGQVGQTGRTTGPHLHFELHRNNFPVDPASYIPQLR